MNWPRGGLVGLSGPQQAIVPSALTAQEWLKPTATAAKRPRGASDWPLSFEPQQTMVLSTLRAQEW